MHKTEALNWIKTSVCHLKAGLQKMKLLNTANPKKSLKSKTYLSKCVCKQDIQYNLRSEDHWKDSAPFIDKTLNLKT